MNILDPSSNSASLDICPAYFIDYIFEAAIIQQ